MSNPFVSAGFVTPYITCPVCATIYLGKGWHPHQVMYLLDSEIGRKDDLVTLELFV